MPRNGNDDQDGRKFGGLAKAEECRYVDWAYVEGGLKRCRRLASGDCPSGFPVGRDAREVWRGYRKRRGWIRAGEARTGRIRLSSNVEAIMTEANMINGGALVVPAKTVIWRCMGPDRRSGGGLCSAVWVVGGRGCRDWARYCEHRGRS